MGQGRSGGLRLGVADGFRIIRARIARCVELALPTDSSSCRGSRARTLVRPRRRLGDRTSSHVTVGPGPGTSLRKTTLAASPSEAAAVEKSLHQWYLQVRGRGACLRQQRNRALTASKARLRVLLPPIQGEGTGSSGSREPAESRSRAGPRSSWPSSSATHSHCGRLCEAGFHSLRLRGSHSRPTASRSRSWRSSITRSSFSSRVRWLPAFRISSSGGWLGVGLVSQIRVRFGAISVRAGVSDRSAG
jgi:hypothetical protein